MTDEKGEFTEDHGAGVEPILVSKEPNYVDLDSEVQVVSAVNVSNDVDNRDEVLRAATMFMKSPNRALSARELGILMGSEYGENYSSYLDALVEAGFIHEVNEFDGIYKRYRVV